MSRSESSISTTSVVRVPGGLYWIGDSNLGEGPQVQMEVEGFLIDRLAVSNQDYSEFIADGGYERSEWWKNGGFDWIHQESISRPAFWDDRRFNAPDQPVTGVSWFEASAFGAWRRGHLPTETQWEAAARGTDERRYPWGNHAPTLEHANFAPGFDPVERAAVPVEACASGDSPFGCRQMAGNTFEWVQDYFHVDTPSMRRGHNFADIRPAPRRVLKGGAWTTGCGRLRIGSRWSYLPTLRDNIVGFRLVYDALSC